MATIWSGWYWHLGLASLLAMGGAIAALSDCVLAQVTPDGTLGAESSVVTPTAPGSTVNVIDGGATRGANLFHSFEQFSVPTGGEASFNNAASIQNIISRVTGGSISNIDGLLRANGTANLFLLNPNGIVFGPNATLNIGGSFMGSTASSLNFADGTQFSATDPTTTPLLTVSVPIGLQYGGTAGSILNQSRATNSNGQVVGLAVQPGATLALLGGNVSLDGGRLQAPGGRVELGGVAGAGTVGLNVNGNNLGLSFPNDLARADVSIANRSGVSVTAGGSGSIAINAQNLNVLGGSFLYAGIRSSLGSVDSQPGDITLNATEAIGVSGSSAIDNSVLPGAVGNGGNINVTTGSLAVTDGAILQASTFGRGNAGSVFVQADDSVSLANSEIFSNVESGAEGNGGNINITTGSLSVRNGAGLTAGTFGQGDAGSVNINAHDTVSFDGDKVSAGSGVESEAVGNGGSINITTGSLSLTNGAELLAYTNGQGDAGSVNINARDTVSFDGVSSDTVDPVASGAFSTVDPGGFGNGGDINITTETLSVTNGAQLQTSTSGRGNAGSVRITARDAVSFDGVGSEGYPSAAFSSVDPRSIGNSGDIDITTGSLSLTNGGRLDARSLGQGNAGNIQVNAADSVELSGRTPDRESPSGLFASSIGTEDAGEIKVTTKQLNILNGATVFAATGLSNGGNITLQVQNVLLLRNQSDINTNAGVLGAGGNGGNIDIDAQFLVAVPSENSDISANASEAFGGRVRISAQGIFGTEFRQEPTEASDITASSRLGPQFSGTVEINNPDVDPAQGLVELPVELIDASNQIAQACPSGVREGKSKFIVTGRGGLPPDPHSPLTGNHVLTNLATLDSDIENRSSTAPATNSTKESAPTTIVEANGWVKGPNGSVTLVATAPTANIDIPWLPESSCNAPKPES